MFKLQSNVHDLIFIASKIHEIGNKETLEGTDLSEVHQYLEQTMTSVNTKQLVQILNLKEELRKASDLSKENLNSVFDQTSFIAAISNIHSEQYNFYSEQQKYKPPGCVCNEQNSQSSDFEVYNKCVEDRTKAYEFFYLLLIAFDKLFERKERVDQTIKLAKMTISFFEACLEKDALKATYSQGGNIEILTLLIKATLINEEKLQILINSTKQDFNTIRYKHSFDKICQMTGAMMGLYIKLLYNSNAVQIEPLNSDLKLLNFHSNRFTIYCIYSFLEVIICNNKVKGLIRLDSSGDYDNTFKFMDMLINDPGFLNLEDSLNFIKENIGYLERLIHKLTNTTDIKIGELLDLKTFTSLIKILKFIFDKLSDHVLPTFVSLYQESEINSSSLKKFLLCYSYLCTTTDIEFGQIQDFVKTIEKLYYLDEHIASKIFNILSKVKSFNNIDRFGLGLSLEAFMDNKHNEDFVVEKLKTIERLVQNPSPQVFWIETMSIHFESISNFVVKKGILATSQFCKVIAAILEQQLNGEFDFERVRKLDEFVVKRILWFFELFSNLLEKFQTNPNLYFLALENALGLSSVILDFCSKFNTGYEDAVKYICTMFLHLLSKLKPFMVILRNTMPKMIDISISLLNFDQTAQFNDKVSFKISQLLNQILINNPPESTCKLSKQAMKYMDRLFSCNVHLSFDTISMMAKCLCAMYYSETLKKKTEISDVIMKFVSANISCNSRPLSLVIQKIIHRRNALNVSFERMLLNSEAYLSIKGAWPELFCNVINHDLVFNVFNVFRHLDKASQMKHISCIRVLLLYDKNCAIQSKIIENTEIYETIFGMELSELNSENIEYASEYIQTCSLVYTKRPKHIKPNLFKSMSHFTNICSFINKNTTYKTDRNKRQTVETITKGISQYLNTLLDTKTITTVLDILQLSKTVNEMMKISENYTVSSFSKTTIESCIDQLCVLYSTRTSFFVSMEELMLFLEQLTELCISSEIHNKIKLYEILISVMQNHNHEHELWAPSDNLKTWSCVRNMICYDMKQEYTKNNLELKNTVYCALNLGCMIGIID